EYLAGWFSSTDSFALLACRRIHSKLFLTKRDDLLYQACIRRVLNPYNRYLIGSVKILPKASGWARESWSTNSKWSEEVDFMMTHGDDSEMLSHPQTPVPNTTWSYDSNLIADQHDLNRHLREVIHRYEKEYAKALKHIDKIL
ncbi:hypothetical protein TELCIR_22525, partial [Teladorsagia circumcincta]